MGKTKKKVELSQNHIEETKAAEEALKKLSEKLITETNALKGYLVVSDEEGNFKKIPAEDL